jgi:hypothetical protein
MGNDETKELDHMPGAGHSIASRKVWRHWRDYTSVFHSDVPVAAYGIAFRGSLATRERLHICLSKRSHFAVPC